MHDPCLDRQTDGKHVGTACPSLSLQPPVSTELPGTDAARDVLCFSSKKMVMVKLEKLLETFYQLNHIDLSVLILCRAQLKPQPNFLGQNLENCLSSPGSPGEDCERGWSLICAHPHHPQCHWSLWDSSSLTQSKDH